jgi:hypothetical protein
MATSVAVSQTMAAPIAAALLKMDGLLGLSGWQVGDDLTFVFVHGCRASSLCLQCISGASSHDTLQLPMHGSNI